MNHRTSADDDRFRLQFEACEVSPDRFDHAAHVRLAYIYLCEHDCSIAMASEKMKQSLLTFLSHLGVDPGKYHETITRAWIMAVHHFMTRSPDCDSASTFSNAHPELLDSKIMLTHYSAEVLFSPRGRQAFVQPDIQSIPPP